MRTLSAHVGRQPPVQFAVTYQLFKPGVVPNQMIGAPANPIIWLGTTPGLNNWYVTANWTGGCLPTCADNVRIVPNGGTVICQPDIGFSATPAAAYNLDLQA